MGPLAPYFRHVVHCYPLSVLRTILINAPGWVRLALNVVQPFFEPSALKIWHLHHGDGLELLEGICDKEMLPAEYGGGDEDMMNLTANP